MNSKIRLSVFVLFAFLSPLSPFVTPAEEGPQVSSDAPAAQAIKRARALIQHYRDVSGVSAISVAVGRKNEILWEEGFGLVDLDNKTSANAKSKFRLGSVSKIITIAAMMRLVERGLIDLDAPVTKYVSGLSDAYNKVTLRQLTGHLAGVRHYKPEDFKQDAVHYDSVKDSLAVFVNDPLLHDPGSKYQYSTFGYVLISAAMETAAGKDFLSIVQEEVFKPLGMNQTTPDYVKENIPNRTTYYELSKEGKVQKAPQEDPSYKWAAAGFLAAPSDLVRFGMAHLHDGYLKTATLNAMFESQATADGTKTGVGLGWRIGKDWRGRTIYHHAGNISGGRSVLVLYPDENLVIALSSNVSATPPFVESTAQMIAEGFLAGENIPKVPTGAFQLSGTNQEKPYQATIEIQRKGDQYSGSISGGFPFIDAAVKNGLPPRLEIAGVITNGKDPAFVLVSPFGLLEMLLTPAEPGYQFTLEEGPAKFEGTMLPK